MKRKSQELISIMILLTLYLGIFLFPKTIVTSGSMAITIFKERLFPSVFPFFVLSFLLFHLPLRKQLCSLFQPLFSFLFHVSNNGVFVILMSIISGFPSGAKYISLFYQDKALNKEEATFLLSFTHFANPLFILGTCGLLLKNQVLAFLIFICQLLSNFIIGFLMRPNNVKNDYLVTTKEPIVTDSFLSCLVDAIEQAMGVILFMLGSIMIFMFCSQVICKLYPFSDFEKTWITGLLDLTSGVSLAAFLPVSSHKIALIMLCFITFGGMSVHLQVIYALEKTDISYFSFLKGRILQTGVACVLFLILSQALKFIGAIMVV